MLTESSSFIYSKNAWVLQNFFLYKKKARVISPELGTVYPLSVGVAPAVMTAAVLSPAVSAAAAFRPPARVSRVVESVSLSTVEGGVQVSLAVETAAPLVVVAAFPQSSFRRLDGIRGHPTHGHTIFINIDDKDGSILCPKYRKVTFKLNFCYRCPPPPPPSIIMDARYKKKI